MYIVDLYSALREKHL